MTNQGIEDEGVRLDPGFEDFVFPAELEALAGRASSRSRRSGDPLGLPDFDAHLDPSRPLSSVWQDVRGRLERDGQHDAWRAWASAAPHQRHGGLTGLALSGGGVRSSTLNLGIVQVLHRLGLFKCFDYLSTVSGGGYLGSSISANYAAADAAGATHDDLLQRSHQAFPYQHVRGRPESSAFLQLRNYSSFIAPRGLVDYLGLPVLLLRGILINFLVILPWLIGAALLTGALLVPAPDTGWLWAWHGVAWWPGSPAAFGPTLFLLLTLLALVVLFPMVWKLQIWLEGVGRTRVLRGHYERAMVAVALLAAVTAWVELQPLAIGYLLQFQREHLHELTALVGGGSALLAMLAHLAAKQLRSLARRFAIYLIALAGFAAFWLLYVLLCVWLIEAPAWWLATAPTLPVTVGYGALLILLVLYSAFLIDANGLSLHNFYRDRLAKAFLFRIENGTVESSPDLKLSELSTRLGPLHLINTTINTSRFPDRFRKGRHGDPFFLSPICSGSRTTGYCPTDKLEHEQPDLTVSSAIATSGAAVTTNMGVQTNYALRAILGFLNIRLGYWLVNPRCYLAGQDRFGRNPGRLLGVGVIRYLQELTGWLDYKRSYVYLSDGGHIENMGIYPLVHRQCRLIVLGDGECDPGYAFQGLLDAIRMIRIDFGVHIEMEGLDAIRNGAQQHALGTIHYPGGRTGCLLYLKSSLLGDDVIEATVSGQAYVSSPLRNDARHYDALGYIAHYKATHPAFPHEPTADQFFDEVQFESYRALGYVIAERTLLGRTAADAAAATGAGAARLSIDGAPA